MGEGLVELQGVHGCDGGFEHSSFSTNFQSSKFSERSWSTSGEGVLILAIGGVATSMILSAN